MLLFQLLALACFRCVSLPFLKPSLVEVRPTQFISLTFDLTFFPYAQLWLAALFSLPLFVDVFVTCASTQASQPRYGRSERSYEPSSALLGEESS